MNSHITLTFKPQASFLLGGVTFNPAYDTVTALDNNHLPYLTPTAIKGAFRMEFEAFTQSILHNEEGKTGPHSHNLDRFVVCDMDKDMKGCVNENCISCSLFGGGDKEGKLRFQAAVIKDPESILLKTTKKVNKEILEKGKREGVSISRELGKSRDKSYYSYLPYPDMKEIMPITFEADIAIREPLSPGETDILELFFAFLSRSGIFMGARKSVGLGHFKIEHRMEIKEKDSATEGKEGTESTESMKADGVNGFRGSKGISFDPRDKTTDKELKLFRVTLKTIEPLVVGHIKNLYLTDTLPYLPASAIGGAIGFALTGRGVPGETVHTLFIEDRSLSPFNFYYKPDDKDKEKKPCPQSLYHPPYPLPASMRRKKGEKCKISDTLLQDYIIKRAIAAGKFPTVKIKKLFEMLYGSSLRPVPICEKPPTSFLTRLAMGRELQKSKKEMLYSMEVINTGCEFHGLVIGEAWIKTILKEEIKHLYIGGKRSRGFGCTAIKSIEEENVSSLLYPDESIDEKLRDLAAGYGIPIPSDRVFFTLDLLSDIGGPDDTPGETLTFETYLNTRLYPGLDLIIEKAFPLLSRRGGYGGPTPNKKKQKPLQEKIMAGSTFLVSVPTTKAAEFIDKINRAIPDSTQYNWESTPLFRLNNPKHAKLCENGGKHE